MKIGFDGRYAEGDLVGIGKYILNLVRRLAERDIECVIFYSKEPKYPIVGKNISSRILYTTNRYLFEQIKLPKAIKEEKIDLYHGLGNIGIPWFCPVPAVLTVHDIIPFLIKDYFNYSKYKFITKFSYWFRLKTSLSKAKKVIVDSEFTKRTLIERFGVEPTKMNVIYLGVSKINFKETKLPAGLEPGKYILNHGGIDIRKNLERLIRSFSKVVSKLPALKLVITGENKTMRPGLEAIARSLNIGDAVIFLGYVKEELLWNLVKQANCLCFPSLIEGFGMPVLEGFAAEVPVITSDASSLPEVAGEAAFLVQPENEEEIAQAMLRVVDDKNLREKLIKAGKQRVKEFSWDKTAEQTLKVYQKVLGV